MRELLFNRLFCPCPFTLNPDPVAFRQFRGKDGMLGEEEMQKTQNEEQDNKGIKKSRQISCKVCNKVLSRNSLKIHMTMVHISSECDSHQARPFSYPCKQCGIHVLAIQASFYGHCTHFRLEFFED